MCSCVNTFAIISFFKLMCTITCGAFNDTLEDSLKMHHHKEQRPFLLGSSGLVASPQVVDVHDESSFILADHVPDFALVNALVLLQVGQKNAHTLENRSF